MIQLRNLTIFIVVNFLDNFLIFYRLKSSIWWVDLENFLTGRKRWKGGCELHKV
jgi:hypothetical protein